MYIMARGSRTFDTRSGLQIWCFDLVQRERFGIHWKTNLPANQPPSLTRSHRSKFNFSAPLTIHIALSASDMSLDAIDLGLRWSESWNLYAELRSVCQPNDSRWQVMNAELPRVKSFWVKGGDTTFYTHVEYILARQKRFHLRWLVQIGKKYLHSQLMIGFALKPPHHCLSPLIHFLRLILGRVCLIVSKFKYICRDFLF